MIKDAFLQGRVENDQYKQLSRDMDTSLVR